MGTGIYPFFCNKYRIERHPNYRLLEDANKENAYLIGDVNTVKSDRTAEYSDDELHSEPVNDEETSERETVPESDDEQDCHVENISVDSVQPHSRIAEIKAAEEMFGKIPKKPENGKPEPAKLQGEETVVAAEPKITNESKYIGVDDNNYLDEWYDEF